MNIPKLVAVDWDNEGGRGCHECFFGSIHRCLNRDSEKYPCLSWLREDKRDVIWVDANSATE